MHHPRCNSSVTEGTVDMYGIVATFVGAKASQYLLILDSKNFEKYVLPIDERITGISSHN